ncbi:hypothetical protein [Candidatus Mesenet endosymbiont of Agriotes lineatus]|uniref:hypothetical protein n=1 Tax=Candidatus Mesenet endosymbiont of Agriotes lineatus TaxID=3077948 RepID=UPI0030CAC9C7
MDMKFNLEDRGNWSLSDLKQKPVIANIAASLWDIGDGVVCFEFNSKDTTINYQTFKLLYDAINIVPKHFKCMLIGNDSANFSSGINRSSSRDNFKTKEEIEYGQSVLQMLKFTSFPTIAAVSGFTLGVGCEIALHCGSIQAYVETHARLTEEGHTLSGLGGYTEMILRYLELKEFSLDIVSTNTTESAKQMYNLHMLKSSDHITEDRKKLLADAKEKVLKFLHNYCPPKEEPIKLSEVKLYLQNVSNEASIKKLKTGFGNQDFVNRKNILNFEKEIALEAKKHNFLK